ncbi:putative integral membrane protein [Hydrogenophaga palleronii]|uniref:Integral membrane protein n=1 Tax=Hydrogenophaga palleronii TaxID=65655 RepID=A0ABU1WRZ1_9BURK|nr:hypothetical protein [Hydrogenophaga palleronii]MDR7151726.1 putative integral membrane protein [Hydrogenophaga palleronii]
MNVQKNAQAKAAPEPKEPVFKTPYEKAFGAYIALTGLIVFFIPVDILKAYPWAVEFTDFMAGWVPQIDLVTSLGIRPEFNRFYYSVLWAMSPVLFVVCCLMGWEGRQRTYPFWSLPLHKAVCLALVLGAIIFATANMGWMTNTRNGVLRFILGNRLGMGYLGNMAYVVGPVMFTAGLFNLILGWLSGAIPRHIRQQAKSER